MTFHVFTVGNYYNNIVPTARSFLVQNFVEKRYTALVDCNPNWFFFFENSALDRKLDGVTGHGDLFHTTIQNTCSNLMLLEKTAMEYELLQTFKT